MRASVWDARLLTCAELSLTIWGDGTCSPVWARRRVAGVKLWSGLLFPASLSREFRLPVGVDRWVLAFSSLTTLALASGLCMDP